jgi:hypothetical protein
VTSPSDSVDAADIRRVDDAQIIWTDAVPTVGGAPGQVRLEPEVARAFSVRLGEVVKSVLGAEVLLDPVLTSFPSMDPVSNNAASQSARMINDARTYLEAWRRQLWEARMALDAQLAAYEDVEQRNLGRT